MFHRVCLFYGQLLRSLLHYFPVGKRLLRAKRKKNVSEEDLIHIRSQLAVHCDSDALLLECRKFCSDANVGIKELLLRNQLIKEPTVLRNQLLESDRL